MREWLIYVGVMAAIFLLIARNNYAGVMAGLLISGPLYLGFGYILAKFGYTRKTMKELRSERTTNPSSSDADASASTSSSSSDRQRNRPAPTSRTSTGRGRPGPKPNRRKR